MPRPITNHGRTAAIAAGRRTYEGPPCPHGHTERHTISRACVECQREGQRRRRGTLQPMPPRKRKQGDTFADILG